MKSTGANFASAAAAKIGGDIVTQTLDTLNSGVYSSGKGKGAGSQEAMSHMYDFQKSVLSAAYLGKGTAIEKKG